MLLFFIFIVFIILYPNIIFFIVFDENIVLIKIVYLSNKQAKNIMAVNSKLIWMKLFCLKMFFFYKLVSLLIFVKDKWKKNVNLKILKNDY